MHLIIVNKYIEQMEQEVEQMSLKPDRITEEAILINANSPEEQQLTSPVTSTVSQFILSNQKISSHDQLSPQTLDRQKKIIRQYLSSLRSEQKIQGPSSVELIIKAINESMEQNVKVRSFLAQQIVTMLNDTNKRVITIGHTILKEIQKSQSVLQQILQILQLGLNSPLEALRVQTLQIFANLLKQSGPRYKQRNIPGRSIIKAVDSLIEQSKIGLQILFQMVHNSYCFFKDASEELAQFIKSIIDTSHDHKIKTTAMKVLMVILYKNRPIKLKATLKQVMQLMVQINPQIRMEQFNNSQVFSQSEDQTSNFSLINYGVKIICKTVQKFNEKTMFPILKSFIRQCLRNPDWRFKYAAIILTSKVPLYILDVCVLAEFIRNNNPKVRYTACNAIKFLLEKGPYIIKIDLATTSLPQLLALIKKQNAPKVLSNAFLTLAESMRIITLKEINSRFQYIVSMKILTKIETQEQILFLL